MKWKRVLGEGWNKGEGIGVSSEASHDMAGDESTRRKETVCSRDTDAEVDDGKTNEIIRQNAKWYKPRDGRCGGGFEQEDARPAGRRQEARPWGDKGSEQDTNDSNGWKQQIRNSDLRSEKRWRRRIQCKQCSLSSKYWISIIIRVHRFWLWSIQIFLIDWRTHSTTIIYSII